MGQMIRRFISKAKTKRNGSRDDFRFLFSSLGKRSKSPDFTPGACTHDYGKNNTSFLPPPVLLTPCVVSLVKKIAKKIWNLVLKLVPLQPKSYLIMGSKDKLVERFKKKPKDFTYEETVSLLAHFGYSEYHKGATSGSRVRFKNESKGFYIDIHRPHPGSIMKEWMVKTIYQHLKNNGFIK